MENRRALHYSSGHGAFPGAGHKHGSGASLAGSPRKKPRHMQHEEDEEDEEDEDEDMGEADEDVDTQGDNGLAKRGEGGGSGGDPSPPRFRSEKVKKGVKGQGMRSNKYTHFKEKILREAEKSPGGILTHASKFTQLLSDRSTVAKSWIRENRPVVTNLMGIVLAITAMKSAEMHHKASICGHSICTCS
ncbi:hypothetical protein F4814DRAFT_451304 [Daldinia grandis]|nr:hypothetical protein F4814DRAFT_451304 [Daldinia grandis]